MTNSISLINYKYVNVKFNIMNLLGYLSNFNLVVVCKSAWCSFGSNSFML